MDKTIIKNYLEKVKKRQGKKLKARTRMQEIVEPYLEYIDWDNKTFAKDIGLIYIYFSKYYKAVSETEFINELNWIKAMNKLHPKQIVQSITNKLKKRNKKI